MTKLVSISTAAELLGVCHETLRDWDRNGTLVPVKTPGNHRRYKMDDIEKFSGDYKEPEVKKNNKVRCKENSESKIEFLGSDTILFWLPVETLRNWKDKSVLDLIQHFGGKMANGIMEFDEKPS